MVRDPDDRRRRTQNGRPITCLDIRILENTPSVFLVLSKVLSWMARIRGERSLGPTTVETAGSSHGLGSDRRRRMPGPLARANVLKWPCWSCDVFSNAQSQGLVENKSGDWCRSAQNSANSWRETCSVQLRRLTASRSRRWRRGRW